MKPIRTRDELLELVAHNAPTKACAVAIAKQGASVLGGFTTTEGFSGWIVRVQGTARQWLIGIWVDEAARKYRVTYPDQVPWAGWLGQHHRWIVKSIPLIDGDVPGEASFQRMQARRQTYGKT